MGNNIRASKVEILGVTVSRWLKYAAIIVTLAGMILYTTEQHPADYAAFSPAFAFSFPAFLDDLSHLRGYGVMTLGLLLLISIPIVKVIFYLADFLLKKNTLYIVICCIILGVFLTSMLLS
ncbi:MAG: hypothetical protein BGO09_15780 [Bacteroidetes bacterium 47-18]|nr:MAG: hypothetical protein BGO09_15780 [Bacteroidetes bacterium 47-18]